uniref:Uncharacterized protein n=1 Tax=Glossina austeni TaxID=7395 RepID=A0A1A9VY76_GLOAU
MGGGHTTTTIAMTTSKFENKTTNGRNKIETEAYAFQANAYFVEYLVLFPRISESYNRNNKNQGCEKWHLLRSLTRHKIHVIRQFANYSKLYTKTKELTLLSCISTGAGAGAEAAEKRARKCYSQPPKVPTIHTSIPREYFWLLQTSSPAHFHGGVQKTFFYHYNLLWHYFWCTHYSRKNTTTTTTTTTTTIHELLINPFYIH